MMPPPLGLCSSKYSADSQYADRECRPYVWTKTADQILTSIANYCTRTDNSGS
jgi:hypothetical protein